MGSGRTRTPPREAEQAVPSSVGRARSRTRVSAAEWIAHLWPIKSCETLIEKLAARRTFDCRPLSDRTGGVEETDLFTTACSGGLSEVCSARHLHPEPHAARLKASKGGPQSRPRLCPSPPRLPIPSPPPLSRTFAAPPDLSTQATPACSCLLDTLLIQVSVCSELSTSKPTRTAP